MESTLQIGLVQYDIAWENPGANMEQLNRHLTGVTDLDLLLLPEMWSTGFTMNTGIASEEVNGPAFEWQKAKASELNCCVAGSISTRENGQFYNRFSCLYPDGALKQYDKKHLFSYGKEDHHYTAGTQQLVYHIGTWKIMAIVCYDLRFPAWCRNTMDYDVLIVVANWPSARIHHWDALLKARAIENQAFVVGVNRVGKDGKDIDYIGHSVVFDMNGNPLLYMGSTEGLGRVELEKDKLTQFRHQYRFLQDRDSFML